MMPKAALQTAPHSCGAEFPAPKATDRICLPCNAGFSDGLALRMVATVGIVDVGSQDVNTAGGPLCDTDVKASLARLVSFTLTATGLLPPVGTISLTPTEYG